MHAKVSFWVMSSISLNVHITQILVITDFVLGLIIPILETSFDKNNKGTVHDRYLIVCTYFKDISEGEIP